MSGKHTRVKICGLRSTDVALVASRAGADFLGFNFVENVRRQIQVSDGARIISEYKSTRGSSESPGLVGLFRNQDIDWVNETARKLGLDYLQLCGDEDAFYISRVELPIFKQVRVHEGSTPTDLSSVVVPLLDSGHGVLLDRYDKNTPGGSGLTFDWALAESLANHENVLLAGGLTPANVQSAIAQLAPWGVDVSSGVETDGVKDPDRIRAFIEAVQSA
ncbi:MAG: phosphoribosylanthranilate isomerase [Chloroflexi bacterium]|nr:phosphoribosylanthranilate isomerase [Chloroflexota bacterium]